MLNVNSAKFKLLHKPHQFITFIISGVYMLCVISESASIQNPRASFQNSESFWNAHQFRIDVCRFGIDLRYFGILKSENSEMTHINLELT